MTHGVTIKMDEDTQAKLNEEGYWLYAFRGIRSNPKAARPLLWYRTQDIFLCTQVAPAERYYAYYNSFTRLEPGQQINAGSQCPIEMNQCLRLNKNGSELKWAQEGQEEFIGFENATDTPFVAGLAQGTGSGTGNGEPFYAEPLYGNQTSWVQPTSKILLVLTTQALALGTVVDKLPLVSPGALAKEGAAKPMAMTAQTNTGILIDAASEREVKYDINRSWSWDGGVWAKPVNVNAGLSSALIEKPKWPS